ncbi:MAG: A/G-specific adenine glycosylase [Verrucomicrobiota bacterium]|nr:A/G-specific adenine glycosylase [Verrucomicrobiota bacterium]
MSPIASPKSGPAFRRALLGWFREHGRDLPWRHTRDPYAILVSEIMLQQTQVATVIPFYNRWLQRFPDFAALAAARESDVLHAWQGLGYYARARNLHAAAKAIVAQGGPFPRKIERIRELPGLGRYTANAVATFAFDRSLPIVEANTARLLARLTNLQISIDSGAGRDDLWETATALVPKNNAGIYNSALIDLGAIICISGQPRCPLCPVRAFCAADEPAKLPIKKARAATKELTERHFFAEYRGRILFEQSADRWRGMWILPRLTNQTFAGAPLHSAQFPFTNHRITLEIFAANGSLKKIPRAQRWFTFRESESIPVPSPHRRALNHLRAKHSTSPRLNTK